MAGNQFVFRGDAQIHLYGQNALIPVHLDHRVLTSIIGAEGSNLLLNDHRYETIKAVKNSSSDNYQIHFIEAFNRPAKVEIRYSIDNRGLEIDLFEASAESGIPILWMGILENNLMPAYEVEWEVFRPVDEHNTAFCALINTSHITSAY